MKTVTFKADEHLCKMMEHLASELHITKSELIRNAIKEYERSMRKEELKTKIERASLKTRATLVKEAKEWEETLLDGLSDDKKG